MIDLKKAKNLAIYIAKVTGSLLLKFFDKIEIVHEKDKKDYCTNMDIMVEKYIIEEICKIYPDHNIISEEAGNLNQKGTKKKLRNLITHG